MSRFFVKYRFSSINNNSSLQNKPPHICYEQQRNIETECNFVSLYYLEYDDPSDLSETAMMIAKKEKIRQGVLAHMDLFCTEPPKLTFPFAEKIVILEVSDVKSPQSIHKYCEKTRLDLSRKGILMKSFFSFSLLEKLK